jgi:adenylate cyclase
VNPSPADWQDELRIRLLPLAQALDHRTGRFLAVVAGTGSELESDAGRLHQSSRDLLRVTTGLTGSAPVAADSEAARVAGHELLEILNRLVGYSQLLIETEEDASTGVDCVVLESLRDLASECQAVIVAHFPLRRSPDQDRPAATESEAADAGRILVVEEDEAQRAGLARALRLLGHTPTETGHGDEAVELLRANSYDLVLLDTRLPGRDGYAVLQFLRTEPRLQSLPVLMTSGLDQVAHTVRSIEAGADDFLPKPIDHVLLRARVGSLLLRRQLRIRQLEQFFPPMVARQLLERPDLLDVGTHREITVMFCDIRGYSTVSRNLGPAGTIEWVSDVMEALTECVVRNEGVLVDFIGDELLAMWGAPTDQPDHATRACRTALEILALLPSLDERWQARIGRPMAFGIGINSGPAWVGNAGTRRKFKYGPAGDTVNIGSRVQGASRYLAAPLVVSGATRDKLADGFPSRRLGQVRVVNIKEPIEMHQVVPAGEPDWDRHRAQYEEALALFERRELQEAARRLGGLIAVHGASGPYLSLMSRTIEGLLSPDRWSAVFELPGK